MVMTFVLTSRSHYNTITKPHARFLLSLMEGLSIDFPSHMIESIIDCNRDTTTRDKLIFPSAITCILTYLHITIPLIPHFFVMGAINKESIRWSVASLAAKRPQVEPSNATPVDLAAPSTRPSSSSTPFSSYRVAVSLTNILEKLQHMHADFGSLLDHLSDEMCQMNTKISHIALRQSWLGGFTPLPSPKPTKESSSSDGRDDDDDASDSKYDDEMMTSQ